MKKLFLTGLVVFSLCLGAVDAGNQGVPTPNELQGGRIITLEEAERLVGSGVMIIDVRSPINFGRGHLPGAVLIAYKGKSGKTMDFDASLDRFSMSKFPNDKQANVLIYSHGDTGWKSYKAAVTAIRWGYTNVSWFRDGFAVWKAAGLPVER